MLDLEIIKTLQTQLIKAVAESIMPDLPVKYVMTVFDPSVQAPEGKWLEVLFVPNNVPNEFWGEEKTYIGLFRLILHWPVDGSGAYESIGVINSISKGFSKGTILEGEEIIVRIIENPNLQNVLEQAPDSLLPLSIRYLSFDALDPLAYVYDGEDQVYDGVDKVIDETDNSVYLYDGGDAIFDGVDWITV